MERSNRWMDRGALALSLGVLLIASVSAGAEADMLLQQVVHSEPYKMIADQAPAPIDTVTIWLGEERAAIAGSGTNAILRRDEDKLYLLNHGARTYSVVDLPCDLAEFFPPDHPQRKPLQRVLAALQTKVTITPTDQTKEINGWPTRLFRIEMQAARTNILSETWATTAAPIDQGLYRDLMIALMSVHPATHTMAAHLDDIEGITVLDEQQIARLGMEMFSTRELVTVREAEAPAGTYTPPAGYTETLYNPGRLR